MCYKTDICRIMATVNKGSSTVTASVDEEYSKHRSCYQVNGLNVIPK